MHLTSDQIQLRDTLRALLQEKVTPEYRLSRAKKPTTSDPSLAQVFTELAFVEGFCGSEPVFTLSDLGVVAFEFGRSLLPEPYLAGLLLGAVTSALPKGADRETLSMYSPLALAISSPSLSRIKVLQIGKNPSSDATVQISGALQGVWLPKISSNLSQDDGGHQGREAVVAFDGPLAYLIPLTLTTAGSDGKLTIKEAHSLDLLTTVKNIELTNVPAFALTKETSTLLRHSMCTMVANEMAGICDYVVDVTCNYLKTRQQFGVPIGGFQALQHSMATSYVESESLRALASFAAWALTHSPPQVQLTALSAVSRAVVITPLVCERAIQAHGGIGFTWEYELHLYLRRARATAATWQLDSEDLNKLCEAANC